MGGFVVASMQNCPYCGKLTDPNLEACPHCGGSLRKSAPPGQRADRARQTCPNCKAMVQEGDIICVVCGTNLLTGQKIAEERAAKPDRRMPLLIGVGVLILILLLVGGLWAYLSTRDPYNQALDLIEQNQFLEAQEILQAHVQESPEDRRALYELGKLQWRNTNYADAAATFERVVGLDPSNAEAAYWAVASHELANPGAPSRTRQVELLERVVQSNPQDRRGWYLLALAYGTQGNSAKQIEALERLKQLDPTNPAPRSALGVALALEGRYDEANQELALAQSEGQSPEALVLQGFVSNLEGAEDEAIEELRTAAGQESTALRWEALTQLGKLLIERGQFAEARGYLDQALALRTNDPQTRYLRAVAIKGLGRFQEALSDFEQLSRENSPYATPASVQAADIYLALDNPERARATVDRIAADADQVGAPYYTVRGRVLASLGEDSAAQEAFGRAVNADPSYAPAYLESGLLYVRRDALQQGLRDLDTYLGLLGENAEGPQVAQIRELTNQLRQTTAPPPPATAS